ncbi:ABC transporter permease [Parendozoicomonas haliclonae]|uniref:Putative aliphatic sulfonates transport permease protein SsuC n=1 Tax=Parendozoicomonas haliclonae TaxID=1960125 RepID=A0A1X7ANF1_9GAMM|nr:ABC transporter permease [Parendozoicomonas haliclonae]SMA49824.1 putative aliphatic sulfonates transport permease protein SsuC [Parendozoicomonas haliclonae]
MSKRFAVLKPLLVFIGILLLWQGLVVGLEVPSFIIPDPVSVFKRMVSDAGLLWEHALVTMAEMLMGLTLGVLFGVLMALTLVYFVSLRPWLLPLLLVTQAIPVFALAPVLMLWFGYGMASKVIMTVLIIFFPVATCCYDGLRQTHQGWLDLAQTMGGGSWAVLRLVRWPSALPALASGLRVAVVVAPIGAVVGEWVGSSAGLGYLMLQANARLWVDLMFAALTVLAICSVGLYYFTDLLLKRLIPWQTSHH